jgi:L-lactate dehydrogenase
MRQQRGSKVVIVGAGFVGSTAAYALMINGAASEIVLIDVNQDRLHGEVADLNHGLSFVRPVSVRAGTYADCQDADVVVLCAGANQKPGETRIDLLNRNASIFRTIIDELKASGTNAILLVATNPVDVMSWITWRLSGFPAERVLGSGTVLDSARFRWLLSRHYGIDPSNVHAHIVGEHGDTEVPVWSHANIAGVRLADFPPGNPAPLPREEMRHGVRDAAYQIIKGKGATYYAIGLALTHIVETIIRDENSVLTVSNLLQGEYGIEGVYLSLPAFVSRSGVGKKVTPHLSGDEYAALRHSAETLRKLQEQIALP